VLANHSTDGYTVDLATAPRLSGGLSTEMCKGVDAPAGKVSAALALWTELFSYEVVPDLLQPAFCSFYLSAHFSQHRLLDLLKLG
jgi:hypothetical protein